VIAVVHLVWGPYGRAPLNAFLASYRAQPAGADHELVVLFNNVDPQQRPLLLAELDGVAHRLLELQRPVQDLAAYSHAARRLSHERVCFLNSFSAMLDAGWLAKLAAGLDAPGTGLAGASGSWQSLRSGVLHTWFLPSPYRGVLPDRHLAREQFIAIEREAADLGARAGLAPPDAATGAARQSTGRSALASLLAVLGTLPAVPAQLARFPGFPAPHLRTNGFIAERVLFASLKIGPVKRKMDAWALESGRAGITRQVQGRGLRAVVVDRRGEAYEWRRWPLSRTFWQGDQEQLLIADNQTRIYANGTIDRRRLLSGFAWGERSDPQMSPSTTASHA
jgi:hypothetical protein